MNFNKIDIHNWDRKEIFNHYLNQQTSFSITSEINISTLYRTLNHNGYKFYPALIFIITKVVNSNTVFRTSFNHKGDLGYWDQLVPLYTIFDQKSETFSAITTDIDNGDFKNFHKMYLSDVDEFTGTGLLFPKKPIPENTVSISMIPWTSFTAFNLMIESNKNHLLPIITAGKFVHKDGSILLPISLQVHHAVCDGYHASRFFESVQQLANAPIDWL
ncbi:type A chloramphenicol O-acetyltransferase [Alkalihalobacillus trypoxylicola]|uniref:Chloramphenicol acetyltransferase n=1 Tax=Alkalihalobacillus trypoxylicola TaxID=519424 RepID=A0A162EP35_9BACI|nr:type A chloramphenicol O-acetyltransferase [Alkalihalobacillus trypoxylicola]KYG33386.1 chloramphenicol acetyltransferase [Alkalihalobacillus trypoxylicola]